MELDDLKESWKKDKQGSDFNVNIMELIKRESDGPISILKKTFKKKFKILAIVSCALAVKNITLWNNDMLMWLFIGYCGIIGGYYYSRYSLLEDMHTLDMTVSGNIKKQVITLEKGVAFHLAIMQIMPVVFAVALEILMYNNKEPFFSDWHKQSFYLRIVCYIGFFVMFFFVKRYAIGRNFSSHVKYLKTLSGQLD